MAGAGGGGGEVGAHDDAVDADGPVGAFCKVGVQAQPVSDGLPGAVQRPAAFAQVDGFPVPEGGQVAPGDAGPFPEQDPGDDRAMVLPPAAYRRIGR